MSKTLFFKQAVEINGHKYPRGANKVHDEDLSHPYLEKLVNAGYVTPSDDKDSKTTLQLQEEQMLKERALKEELRQAAHAKKLKEDEEAKQAKIEAKKEELEISQEAEAQVEEVESESKGYNKKSKHKR